MSTMSTLNEKYGLKVDTAIVAAIVVGIALVSVPIVTTMAAVAGVVAGTQIAILYKEA